MQVAFVHLLFHANPLHNNHSLQTIIDPLHDNPLKRMKKIRHQKLLVNTYAANIYYRAMNPCVEAMPQTNG
jgi:hypothetical protein